MVDSESVSSSLPFVEMEEPRCPMGGGSNFRLIGVCFETKGTEFCFETEVLLLILLFVGCMVLRWN